MIGGGISGTFVTKYLTDYDPQCTLESLTIFEPYPVTDTIKKGSSSSNNNNTLEEEELETQGSRVSTLELEDGTLVELGASILSDSAEEMKRIFTSVTDYPRCVIEWDSITCRAVRGSNFVLGMSNPS